jgi:hypothetical protein
MRLQIVSRGFGSHGAEVLIDGQPATDVTRIVLTLDVDKITRAEITHVIEMLEVDVDVFEPAA